MILIDGIGSYKLKHYCPIFIETIKIINNPFKKNRHFIVKLG